MNASLPHDGQCVHAVIPRLGLGNSMFPWARAEVFSARFNVPMLAPVWFKPMFGPLLRGEVDKRVYWRLFQPSGFVGGVRRLGALALGRRHPEPEDWHVGAPFSLPADGVVMCSGLKMPNSDMDYFRPLWGQRALLTQRLEAICRPETLRPLQGRPGGFIGLHVRRGDLAGPLSNPDFPAHIPEPWFPDALRHLRQAGLPALPIKIMTDGGAETRAQFREFPGVEFVDLGNAVANILFMAKAAVFLGTGYSTFSRWISYLGGMPTLYYPGYVPPDFGDSHGAYSGGFDLAAPLPDSVRDQVLARLN